MGTRRVRRKDDGEFTLFFRKVSPFSNHHPAEFDSDGAINFEKEVKRFSCTEQFYMYNKASLMEDRKLMSAVLRSDNPKAMKAMCSKGALRGWRDSEWNKHKEDVMYIGSKAKYRASRHLCYALFLSTGSQLVECSPFDPVWGIGNNLETVISDSSISLSTGQNLLGKILDRVRDELWEDEQYRNEREEVEKRLKLDDDYLLKAMKHVDLMYKERATVRSLISMGHVSRDDQSYLTSEVRQLLPEWALPPPIEKFEPIRPSPPVIIDFPRTPPRRFMTPERISSVHKRRRRSSSRLTLNRSWSRSRSRSRSRRRSERNRVKKRKREEDDSGSESPPWGISWKRRRRSRSDSRRRSRSSKESRRHSRSSEEKEERRRRKKEKRSRRSESQEERRRIRKQKKREKKEKKKEKKQRRRRRSSSSLTSS
ncbi:hypothetical protein L5515_006202 [Caenorhabditis briggsae]|uniref:NADAR domain-containing protein n=1 Tax=Caenorhabditis briggsae TaxID=6238 RepID=A0AAE9F1J2_CAEBR|nr:hypothetical protein L5515_006202 [Caenorhabditis briggsae]